MSVNGPEDANLLGGLDYEKLSELGNVKAVTITTNQVSGSSTEQFKADEGDAIVDSVELTPETTSLPKNARIVSVKVNAVVVDSNNPSTDSDFAVYQSSSYNEIEQVVSVSNIDVEDNPTTYILGGGLGMPFINKEGDNQIYFEFEELSGNIVEYSLELTWYSIGQ